MPRPDDKEIATALKKAEVALAPILRQHYTGTILLHCKEGVVAQVQYDVKRPIV